MPEYRPLSLYAVKTDPNILADITFYEDGKITHHETIVRSKKAFNHWQLQIKIWTNINRNRKILTVI